MMPAARDLAGLTAFLDARMRMSFAWGRDANDCVSFVVGAIEAQGIDPQLGDLAWTDEETAAAAIDGVGGLEAALDARFGRVAPSMAMRGDVVGVADELGPFGIRLMIVEGITLVGPGDRRATRWPRSKVVVAWSILAAPGGDGA